MSLLLDSVIFIDHFNNIEPATEFIETHVDDIHLSVITRAEILVGFTERQVSNARELLDVFPTISLTKTEADLAAKLRRTHGWKLPDAIQAAISKHHKLKLITRNTKDFNPKKHSFVSVPYTL